MEIGFDSVRHTKRFVFVTFYLTHASIEEVDDLVQPVDENSKHERRGVTEHYKYDLRFAAIRRIDRF